MTVAQSFPLQAKTLMPRSRVGRPRTADDPSKRQTQIKYAALVLSGVLLVKQAAAAAGVTRVTIWRWINEALASDEPEAEGLRRLYGGR